MIVLLKIRMIKCIDNKAVIVDIVKNIGNNGYNDSIHEYLIIRYLYNKREYNNAIIVKNTDKYSIEQEIKIKHYVDNPEKIEFFNINKYIILIAVCIVIMTVIILI